MKLGNSVSMVSSSVSVRSTGLDRLRIESPRKLLRLILDGCSWDRGCGAVGLLSEELGRMKDVGARRRGAIGPPRERENTGESVRWSSGGRSAMVGLGWY